MSSASDAANSSQFETLTPRRRVVLLGASNLALTLPMIVGTARATWGRPLEFFVAMGFGRSYGQESKIFWKKFSGILQSGLWAALDRAPRLPTVALVADVGNDLAYEATVDIIIQWVSAVLDRLAEHGARMVLNNIPIESLRSVGRLRYWLLRSLLFPRCRLRRDEILSRAEELTRALAEMAEKRKIPIFSGQNASYGLDPIHPRRRFAGELWQRMIAALEESQEAAPGARPTRADAQRLRRMQRVWWSLGASTRVREALSVRLDDGSTIALF
jgi:hypothetical protein